MAKDLPSTKPLYLKLGLKPGLSVLVWGCEGDYSQLTGAREANWTLVGEGEDPHTRRTPQGGWDFIHVFIKDRPALLSSLAWGRTVLRSNGQLWISWPKKSSGRKVDFDENTVIRLGIEAGLVDVKVCSVDAVWSGLKFVFRLKDRPAVIG